MLKRDVRDGYVDLGVSSQSYTSDKSTEGENGEKKAEGWEASLGIGPYLGHHAWRQVGENGIQRKNFKDSASPPGPLSLPQPG